MSFTFASYNEYGIVISADRRFTGQKNGYVSVVANNGRKLFLTHQGYAISFAGSAMEGSIPMSVLIANTLDKIQGEMLLSELFSEFIGVMEKLCSENVIFLAAGYENGRPHILTATTKHPEVKELDGLGYAGESDIAERIICAVPIAYSSMTLQDRIDFHRCINTTISKLQAFGAEGVTVSEECDIAVLGINGVLFSAFSELK